MPRLIGILNKSIPKSQLNYKFILPVKLLGELQMDNIDLAVVGGEIPSELQTTLEITSYAEDELALNFTY